MFYYEWDKGPVSFRILKLDALKETTLTEYSINTILKLCLFW